MRKRLITTRALPIRRNQFRVLKDGLCASSFRGAIGSEFHEWLSRQWGFTGGWRLGPVIKLFLKQPSLLDFFYGQTDQPPDVFNYTLLAQVQMRLALGVSNRMFFENSTYVSGRTFAATREQTAVRFLTAPASRQFWLSLSRLLTPAPARDRDPGEPAALSFITEARSPSGKESPTWSHRGESGWREILGASFTTLLQTRQRWLQLLKRATFRDASGLGRAQGFIDRQFLSIFSRTAESNLIEEGPILVWPALVLRKILAAFTAGNQLSQQWSLPSLLIARTAVSVPSPGGAVAGLTPLTLVLSQRGSSGVETNTQTRFAESSTMHFAKHTSQLIQKLGSILKEGRQTQPEVKAVAPPSIEIERLTRQVHQQLEREIRIEKERRGL